MYGASTFILKLLRERRVRNGISRHINDGNWILLRNWLHSVNLDLMLSTLKLLRS